MYCLDYADTLELVDLTLLYVQYTNLEILFPVIFLVIRNLMGS